MALHALFLRTPELPCNAFPNLVCHEIFVNQKDYLKNMLLHIFKDNFANTVILSEAFEVKP